MTEKQKQGLTFGERLKIARAYKGLSQRALGKAIKVSNPTITNYENNRIFPSLDTLRDIASVLNVSTDYLLGLTPEYMKIDAEVSEEQEALMRDAFNPIDSILSTCTPEEFRGFFLALGAMAGKADSRRLIEGIADTYLQYIENPEETLADLETIVPPVDYAETFRQQISEELREELQNTGTLEKIAEELSKHKGLHIVRSPQRAKKALLESANQRAVVLGHMFTEIMKEVLKNGISNSTL